MKNSLGLAAALIAAFATPAAFAEESQGTAPAAYAKDSAIFLAVKSKLKAEHVNSFSHLQVLTDNDGMVLLKGKVESQEEADRAVALAAAAENVKAVRSELVVKTSD